jgi:hypothetical protein
MPGTPITNPADVSVAMPGNSLIPQGPLRSQNIGPDLSPQTGQSHLFWQSLTRNLPVKCDWPVASPVSGDATFNFLFLFISIISRPETRKRSCPNANLESEICIPHQKPAAPPASTHSSAPPNPSAITPPEASA